MRFECRNSLGCEILDRLVFPAARFLLKLGDIGSVAFTRSRAWDLSKAAPSNFES
jgi:hypothetical protein